MPVDRKLMGPNPSRPIRPSFGVPKKKKPTSGMASPGPKKKRKLTPKKPNMAQVAGKKKAKGNSLTKKNNSAVASPSKPANPFKKKKPGSMYA